MKSRFEFLEERFPKLAGYGKKAEEVMNSDKNICLLNLGRIAEKIIEILCAQNKIDFNGNFETASLELLRLGIIENEIYQKISALTTFKNEAVNNDYDSETACLRLIETACELCGWFVKQNGESRFSFLADLFPNSDSVPVLAELAEFGKEAEENLFSNTRYSVICMGDIGESIAYILLHSKNISHEKDQIDRIRMLVNRSIIPKGAGNLLHELRIARNQAIHSRYNLESDARELLNESLDLCEWIFRTILSENDIIRSNIISFDGVNISVNIGRISGTVERSEIPFDDEYDIKNFCSGSEKKLFRVLDPEGQNIKLSLKNINSNPWIEAERRYSKYMIGQIVNAQIQTITKTMGAIVELKDGLQAKIPDCEMGRKIYNRTKGIKFEVKASVKWFDPKHYPYMILSVKDIEDENISDEDNNAVDRMPDSYFLDLCKSENSKTISEELEKGANPNAKNRKGMTALMIASIYNKDHEVLESLLNYGAKVNAKNYKGNTALIFSAMYNTPNAVKVLLNNGADINIKSREGHKAFNYALSNKKLRKNKSILNMLKGVLKSEKTEVKNDNDNEVKKIKSVNAEFLEICRKGKHDDIINALNNGADINSRSSNNTTALMFASQFGSVETVNALIERGAEINAKNNSGNNALHFAAGYGTREIVEALIKAGADFEAVNKKGIKPKDIAGKRHILKGTEILKMMTNNKNEIQKDFIRICRSGSEQEISEAINAGVNVNSKTKSLSTALMFAAKDNTADVVELLIKSGAYIDAQNIYGNTALIYAVSYNTDDVVNVLIDSGADTQMKNISGYKALDYAKQNYRLEGSEVLEKL